MVAVVFHTCLVISVSAYFTRGHGGCMNPEPTISIPPLAQLLSRHEVPSAVFKVNEMRCVVLNVDPGTKIHFGGAGGRLAGHVGTDASIAPGSAAFGFASGLALSPPTHSSGQIRCLSVSVAGCLQALGAFPVFLLSFCFAHAPLAHFSLSFFLSFTPPSAHSVCFSCFFFPS